MPGAATTAPVSANVFDRTETNAVVRFDVNHRARCSHFSTSCFEALEPRGGIRYIHLTPVEGAREPRPEPNTGPNVCNHVGAVLV